MKQFNFTLTEQEVNTVLKALAKLPLEEVIQTFSKIKLSAEEQLKEIPTVEKEKKD